MNDRLWTMKVVIENVRKFVCVMKTKFLCLGNFHFPAQPCNKLFSQYLCGIHLLVTGTILEEALITRYFGTVN